MPENFVVTLAKVTIPSQVAALAGLLARLEEALGLPQESLKLEIMVETPQAIVNARGECNVLPLVGLAPLPLAIDVARGCQADERCGRAGKKRLQVREAIDAAAEGRIEFRRAITLDETSRLEQVSATRVRTLAR